MFWLTQYNTKYNTENRLLDKSAGSRHRLIAKKSILCNITYIIGHLIFSRGVSNPLFRDFEAKKTDFPIVRKSVFLSHL
jgi:hypothetical protein